MDRVYARTHVSLIFTLAMAFACSSANRTGEAAPSASVSTGSSDGGPLEHAVVRDGGSRQDASAIFREAGRMVSRTGTDAAAGNDAAAGPGPSGSGDAHGALQADAGPLSTANLPGCETLAVAQGAVVDSTVTDTYTWYDGNCAARTAVLFRNDATDGFGESGGYLRRISYESGGQLRTCTGTGQNEWYGFGYIVNHYGVGEDDTNTQATLGEHTVVLAGRHHAIHEFRWSTSPGGPVNVTARWIFMTGRSHPLFAITFDATPAGPNTVLADTRAPYGDLAWDSDTDGDVSGVGWGDRYKFATTGAGPVTPTSSWDYTALNSIPFAMEWSNAADAEMGLVATEAWTTRVQGGDYGDGLLSERWGQTGTNLLVDLPEELWPFQLDQYDLADETNSHRVAWGASFGAVGQTSYEAFGQTASGYPFQSYSLFVVLGTHGVSAVSGEIQEIETIQSTSLTSTRGTVTTSGPAGVGRTDAISYVPSGFDPVYAAWDATLEQNAATVSLSIPSGSLTNPVFHFHGYTALGPPDTVTFAGRTLAADSGYFATVDSATQSLWLTLNLTAVGTETLTVGGAGSH